MISYRFYYYLKSIIFAIFIKQIVRFALQLPIGYVTISNRQIGNGLRIGHWSQFFKLGDEMLSKTHLQLLLFFVLGPSKCIL